MTRSTSGWLRTIVLLAQAVAFVVALPANDRRNLPSYPSNDPFYTPPAGFGNQAPGTILRSRTINPSFAGLVPNPVQGWQLLYRTTAINGTPIATVTTIFKPQGAYLDRFVSFQTAYDSSSTICDPSYTYQLGAIQNDLITTVEEFLLEGYLIEGYIVAAPDYEGPDAAFGPGHLEGMGVLDGMKAVRNFASTLGLTTTNPKIFGYGYSGGSIATGWAASLKNSYASNLNVVGWAMGGTPANLTGTLEFIDGTLFSGFLVTSLDGLNKPSTYGAQLTPFLNSVLTSYGASVLAKANTVCAISDILDFPEKSVLSTSFTTLGSQLIYQPVLASILAQNTMGVSTSQTPSPPIYMYHATYDEIIPYGDASALRSRWCNNGATVHFNTFANGGHATTEALGFPGAVVFTQNAFAGNVASGCTTSTSFANTLNPFVLGSDLEPVVSKLINALNDLGNGDQWLIDSLQVLEDNI